MPDIPDDLRAEYEAYDRHAQDIVSKLKVACAEEDGDMASRITGHLMHSPPQLLIMVLTKLTLDTVMDDRPLAEPAELGLDVEHLRATTPPWTVALNDQLAAASEANDYEQYSDIAVHGIVRSLTGDFIRHRMDEGSWPDVASVLRSTMLMPHSGVCAVAAKLLREETIRELEK